MSTINYLALASRKTKMWVCLLGMLLVVASTCLGVEKREEQSCGIAAGDTRAIDSSPATKASEGSVPASIKLTWNASIPASTSPRDAVIGYNILRHEPGDACEYVPSTCPRINRNPIPGTSCIDYGVKSGHTYVYQAQAVSVSGAASQLSNVAKVTLPLIP